MYDTEGSVIAKHIEDQGFVLFIANAYRISFVWFIDLQIYVTTCYIINSLIKYFWKISTYSGLEDDIIKNKIVGLKYYFNDILIQNYSQSTDLDVIINFVTKQHLFELQCILPVQ